MNAAERMQAELKNDPAALAVWSRMVALLVDRKADYGAASVPDGLIAETAPNIMAGLMRVVATATAALPDPVAAHRLQRLEWFTTACAAEQSGAVPPATLN